MLLDIFIFILLFIAAALFQKLKILEVAAVIKNALMKNFSVFQSPAISDHWKEKYLFKNSLRTLGLSLKMLLLIAAFLLAVFIPLKIVLFSNTEKLRYISF